MSSNKIVLLIHEPKQNRKWNVSTKKKRITMSWDGRVLGMKPKKKERMIQTKKNGIELGTWDGKTFVH